MVRIDGQKEAHTLAGLTAGGVHTHDVVGSGKVPYFSLPTEAPSCCDYTHAGWSIFGFLRFAVPGFIHAYCAENCTHVQGIVGADG